MHMTPAPDGPDPQRWVPASVIRAASSALPRDNADELIREIDELRSVEPLRDPWKDGE